MPLPIVAIVGRPNVGKSSLLNRLAGRRIAIVDATPGVTRDRISATCEVGETSDKPKLIELVDTGGMGIEDVDDLTDHVETQIAYAVEAASLILFIVDARQGAATLDRHVAESLRRRGKSVLLVANKIDSAGVVTEVGEMNALGFGHPIEISATHGLGVADLRDAIAEALADVASDLPAEPVMKLAIVGKRNAGKSTFINALAGQQRLIVSEKPGTTRDSVDVTIEMDGKRLTLIDTAGVRKKRKLAGDIEYYSQHRAMRSIRRADVVAMLIDASVPVSQVDKSLAGEIAEQLKPVALVVNKWDLAQDRASGDDYAEYLTKTFPELSFAPVSLTAAINGKNLRATIRLAEHLFDQANTRVPTARLNECVEEILQLRGPSHKSGTRPPKIFYASQIATAPPTVVCFVNDVRSFDTSYQRFFVNRLRERLPFAEVPIRLIFRRRRGGRQE